MYRTSAMLEGVGKNAPTETNDSGGKQSAVPYAFDCFDPNAMFAMAKVLKEGKDKYGKNNWKKIPTDDHLNHLLMHIFAFMAGDQSDEHMAHIMCRAMFAAGVYYDA